MGSRDNASYYDVLEVTQNATFEEIEQSYQRLSSFLAPDSLAVYSMVDEDEAHRQKQRVEEAYRTLCDPDRRAAYDRARQGDASYTVLVPEDREGSNLSVGMVHHPPGERQDEPVLDVDAIFSQGGASPDEPLSRAEPVPEVRVAVSQASAPPSPRPAAASASAVSARPSQSATATSPMRARPAPQRMGSEKSNSVSGIRSWNAPRPKPSPVPPRKRLQPSVDIEVGTDTEFSGALLRRLRESASGTLDDVAEITKVSKRYIHALEEHDFEALPASVYVRGFVCEYARALGLDPQRVAQSYMSLYKRYKGEGP